ncbi:MAG TPA: glycosyl transferase [Rhodospirillaceae bacterium]|nr:glycosyl transferase [Rhodospirillaceae bacterium]
MLEPQTQSVHDFYDARAEDAGIWAGKNQYFHDEDARYMRFLVPEGLKVLDLGCGNGDMLAALAPKTGIGVDISPKMVALASSRHEDMDFRCGDIENPDFVADLAKDGPFDIIIMTDCIGELRDVQKTFDGLHGLCSPDTRMIVAYHTPLWRPILTFSEKLGMKRPSSPQSWLSAADIGAILSLSDFEEIKHEWRQIFPKHAFGIGPFLNKVFAPLPFIRGLCLRSYTVLRSRRQPPLGELSCTVLVPCRNEKGNIEAAITRTPRFCKNMEILFVEGHSSDGTLDEINRVIKAYPQLDIKVSVQPGKGKGDAVRHGFGMARGDILMILDADLTMPPEDLPKYYAAITSGKAEFVNGTRLVYPMENEAMRFLNHMANATFAWIFSFLLNQRFTDTLCGTKVLRKRHYDQIVAGRSYFGDFDPFGDFDLIFGASKLNLKVVEIPVRYQARSYGSTQISRFRHGVLLLRMVVFAYRKLKAF